MKPETKFRKKVNAFLNTLKNTWHVSVQQQAIRGIPDKLLCCRGKFLALELKAPGKKATILQAHVLHEIELAGGYTRVVSEDNWELVKFELLQLDGG